MTEDGHDERDELDVIEVEAKVDGELVYKPELYEDKPLLTDYEYRKILARLKPQQMIAVEHYLKHGNIGKAGKAAGYGPNNRTNWMRSKDVQAIVAFERAKALNRVIVDKNWLLIKLQENHDAAVEAGNHAAVNASIKLAAELTGYLGKGAKAFNVDNQKNKKRQVYIIGDKEIEF